MRKLIVMLAVVLLVAMLPAAGLAQRSQPPAQTPQNAPVPFVLGGGQPGVPAGVQDVLFEQVYDGYGWWASQCFPDLNFCYYTGDDVVTTEPWSITTIYVNGDGAIINAIALNWFVYPDAGGVPAGYPGDGTEFWSLSLPPTAPGVTINAGQVTLDLVAATGSPLALPAGHWWLVFYPDMPINPYGQWGWYTGAPSQYYPGVQYIGSPPWQIQAVGFAFRLEGTVGPPGIPAHINKDRITWAPAARPGLYKVVFTARIWDNLSQPVVATTVYGTWTLPDGTTHDKTYVTDTMGRAKFQAAKAQTGIFTFCVTDISGYGYVYDPLANTAPECLSVTVTP